jgi:hypothetical protein
LFYKNKQNHFTLFEQNSLQKKDGKISFVLWFVVCGLVNAHVQGAKLKKCLAFGVWRLDTRRFMVDSFLF